MTPISNSSRFPKHSRVFKWFHPDSARVSPLSKAAGVIYPAYSSTILTNSCLGCHRESLHTAVHNRLSSRDLKLRRPHFQNGRQNNDAKEHGQKESPLTKSLPHLLNLVSRPHFLSDFPGFGLGEKVSVNWIIWCLEEIQHVIYFFCLILFYGFWAPDSAPWFWTTHSNLLMDCFDNSEEEKMCLWLCFSVRLIKKATK